MSTPTSRRDEKTQMDRQKGPSAAGSGQSGPSSLAELLLSPEEAAAMAGRRGTQAAVLLPLSEWPDDPGLIFTERRADLRRHAGEISFPGGRQDPEDAELATTALREAQEEIALDPGAVELTGALAPVS